jgi:hypothetical protein
MEGNTGICSLLGRGKIRFWEWRYGSCKILTLKIQKKVTWPGKISTTTSSFFQYFSIVFPVSFFIVQYIVLVIPLYDMHTWIRRGRGGGLWHNALWAT